MLKAHGQRIKTWVKWDPDDMSQIWVQDPRNEHWVASPCRWGGYANGLSWNQHLQIRKFARVELKLKGAYDDLERARIRLHDHWQESVSWKTWADQKLAARYSGATSARVLDGPPQSPKAAAPEVPPVSVRDIKKLPPFNPDDFEVVDL